MCWYKPLMRPFVAWFIAGETLEDAIAYAKRLQHRGIHPVLDYLGEGAQSKEEAVRVSNEYIHILDGMHRNHLGGAVSLKLTAFALDLDEETCYRAVSRVVRHAKERKITVWVDMESSPYTTKTLRVYRRLLSEYDNVGVCIQAYMRRAQRDILSLLPDEPKIRLVKGAYSEKKEIAFQTHREITEHYKKLLTLLSEKDAWTAVATHDMELIAHALTLPFPNHMEFQMLKGIRGDEKKLLAEAGYTVMEYVPYGKDWDKYVFRRIKERWRNILWIIQAFASIGKKE